MNKILLGFGAVIGAVALAPNAHAQTTPVSSGSIPASGETLVTMTMPKFAEVSAIPPSVDFTVTSTEYGKGTTNSRPIDFKVRTNSTAGLTVSVAGSADGSGSLNNADIALSSNRGNGITALTTSAQPIWTSDANNDFPSSNNVQLGLTVNRVNAYTVSGNGAAGTATYSKNLIFTALPN